MHPASNMSCECDSKAQHNQLVPCGQGLGTDHIAPTHSYVVCASLVQQLLAPTASRGAAGCTDDRTNGMPFPTVATPTSVKDKRNPTNTPEPVNEFMNQIHPSHHTYSSWSYCTEAGSSSGCSVRRLASVACDTCSHGTQTTGSTRTRFLFTANCCGLWADLYVPLKLLHILSMLLVRKIRRCKLNVRSVERMLPKHVSILD